MVTEWTGKDIIQLQEVEVCGRRTMRRVLVCAHVINCRVNNNLNNFLPSFHPQDHWPLTEEEEETTPSLFVSFNSLRACTRIRIKYTINHTSNCGSVGTISHGTGHQRGIRSVGRSSRPVPPFPCRCCDERESFNETSQLTVCPSISLRFNMIHQPVSNNCNKR